MTPGVLALPSDLDAIDSIIAGKRPEGDVYPTPEWAVDAILREIRLPVVPRDLAVLDPGAGNGVWGTTAANLLDCYVQGVELRDVEPSPGFAVWKGHTDFLTWMPIPPVRFHLVVGNPPYSLAEEFIRHSFELLAPGGQIVFLLRLAFLEGQARAKGLWTEFPPERVLVMPKRPSFSGNGKTDAIAYAAFYWRQGFRGAPALGWLS